MAWLVKGLLVKHEDWVGVTRCNLLLEQAGTKGTQELAGQASGQNQGAS